jgi:hypothetical protein
MSVGRDYAPDYVYQNVSTIYLIYLPAAPALAMVHMLQNMVCLGGDRVGQRGVRQLTRQMWACNNRL